MADYQSGLPVRSQQDADERVQTKIVDATNVAQQLEVDAQSRAKVKPVGNDGGGTERILRLSEQGEQAVDGVYNVTTNTNPANIGLIGHVRAASPADSDQTRRLTAITNGTATSLDVAIRDSSGAAFSESNPLPVYVQDSAGTEVNDYNTAAAVAAGASSNHDYTVPALQTLTLTQVIGTGSGKAKLEIQVETAAGAGTFTTRAVLFNSTATPNMEWRLAEPIRVATGVKIRVIRTNRDNQAQDLYSTICGHLF